GGIAKQIVKEPIVAAEPGSLIKPVPVVTSFLDLDQNIFDPLAVVVVQNSDRGVRAGFRVYFKDIQAYEVPFGLAQLGVAAHLARDKVYLLANHSVWSHLIADNNDFSNFLDDLTRERHGDRAKENCGAD